MGDDDSRGVRLCRPVYLSDNLEFFLPPIIRMNEKNGAPNVLVGINDRAIFAQ